MKKTLIFLAIVLLMACTKTPKQVFNYPLTTKVDTVNDYFGTKVADPYRWLEDDNSAETAEWVKAQNEVTFGYLNSIPCRDTIKNRLTQLWNYEKYGTPFKKGDRYYFFKNNGLQNQYVMYMLKELDGEAEVLLDPNTFSEDGTVALSGLGFSKDGKYLAYSKSTGGSDWVEIFVKEIETGQDLTDHIKWVKFSGISWFKDGFFYNRYEEPKEGDELSQKNENSMLYYHKVGTDQSEDKLILKDPENPDYMFHGGVTDDEKYLIITITESTYGNALYFKDLSDEKNPIQKIVENFDSEYGLVDHIDGKLYFKTDNDAPKGRLIAIDVNNFAKENWVDIIPEKENVLQSIDLAGGKIVADYMQDARSKVEIFNLDGTPDYELELPTIGTLGGFNGELDENQAFYSFTSFTYPTVIFSYNFETKESKVYRKPEMNFDFSAYETKQVFYKSKDGTKVPMFIVHKKGLELNGNNPTLLYGYGGFNISLTPSFSISNLILLENGGVYALANIRGGGEYGEEWHKAGTKLQKQNVFDDFIAAGEYLVNNKYTSPEKLAVRGGSNGGLLVGAVINQRPELFKVAFPAVGVMDMLRYHKFTIGYAWAADYGTSEDDEEMFKYLYAYSPLHNISENKAYPAVLVTTADHDDRVVPAHSYLSMRLLYKSITKAKTQ